MLREECEDEPHATSSPNQGANVFDSPHGRVGLVFLVLYPLLCLVKLFICLRLSGPILSVAALGTGYRHVPLEFCCSKFVWFGVWRPAPLAGHCLRTARGFAGSGARGLHPWIGGSIAGNPPSKGILQLLIRVGTVTTETLSKLNLYMD